MKPGSLCGNLGVLYWTRKKCATPKNQLKTCLKVPTHIKGIKKVPMEKETLHPRVLGEIVTLSHISLELDMASSWSKSISVWEGKNPTSGPITFAIGALNHLPTSRLFLSNCHSNLNLLPFFNTVFDRTPTFNKSWWRGMSLYSWRRNLESTKRLEVHLKISDTSDVVLWKTLPISFPSRVEFCLSCSLLNP